MTTMSDLSRQRLDYSEGPNGETIAILTVTLQGGEVYRFKESVDDEEIDALAAGIAAAEARELRISGLATEEEIAGIFGSIAKAFKSVANIAKKVVTSKVFKKAGKALAAIAPALGPYAPAAMGISAGMQTASKLGAAANAASAGARQVSKKMVRSARRKASRKVRGKRKPLRRLMSWANKTAKAGAKLAGRKKSRRRRRRKPTGRRRKTKRPNILAAARAGKLRSNRKGDVSAGALRRAAKTGRVYWLAA